MCSRQCIPNIVSIFYFYLFKDNIDILYANILITLTKYLIIFLIVYRAIEVHTTYQYVDTIVGYMDIINIILTLED